MPGTGATVGAQNAHARPDYADRQFLSTGPRRRTRRIMTRQDEVTSKPPAEMGKHAAQAGLYSVAVNAERAFGCAGRASAPDFIEGFTPCDQELVPVLIRQLLRQEAGAGSRECDVRSQSGGHVSAGLDVQSRLQRPAHNLGHSSIFRFGLRL